MNSPAGDARIIDRGYQHYDGVRLGPGHGFWVMLRAGMERGMGIRRPFRTKILPWLLLLTAIAAVLISVGSHEANPAGAASPPTYPQFLGSRAFGLLLALFTALVAPDLLCPDRRERVLTLYFAAPITRLHYALARLASQCLLLLGLTLIPPLLLFVSNALFSNSAVGYVRDHLHDLGHLVVAGLLMALFYGVIGCAVAGFSDRRAVATGSIIGVLLVTGFAGGVIGEGLTFSGHQWFVLLDLQELPARVVRWLFGLPPIADSQALTPGTLDAWAYLVALVVVMVTGIATLLGRYRQGEI